MAPVGRPPFGYEWKDGFGWIRTATGEPLSQEAYRAELRRRQRDREAKVLGRTHGHTGAKEAENAEGSRSQGRCKGVQAKAADVARASAFEHPRTK